MKKGFTLAELLCVVIIIGILVILAIPNITNILRDEESNISDDAKSIITQAAELYIQDNSEIYTKTNENVYCIKLNKLVSESYLPDPLKDPVTKDEVDTDYYVKASVIGNDFKYDILDSCSEVRR